jgi:hypothetical protein
VYIVGVEVVGDVEEVVRGVDLAGLSLVVDLVQEVLFSGYQAWNGLEYVEHGSKGVYNFRGHSDGKGTLPTSPIQVCKVMLNFPVSVCSQVLIHLRRMEIRHRGSEVSQEMTYYRGFK